MRAYLRLDPHLADQKRDYPDGALRAFVETLCFAEQQPVRGYFRNERLWRVLLDKRAKWLSYLVEHGDLVVQDDGTIYVDGWEEWQEGDHKVADRMTLIYARKGQPYRRSPGALRQAQYRERTKVFERDNYTCRYCGNGSYPREWLVLEHVIPNGPSTEDNLVTACRPCNKLKGGRTPEEAGMVLRNVTVTSDGNADPSRPSSGGGRQVAQAESGGGVTPVTPTTFMGFRPRKTKPTEAEIMADIRRQHDAAFEVTRKVARGEKPWEEQA